MLKYSKIKDVRSYNPSLAYTSTVVTMTNNMKAIKEHSTKTNNSSQSELLDLINNVHKGEKAITNVFASVSVNNSPTDNVAMEGDFLADDDCISK